MPYGTIVLTCYLPKENLLKLQIDSIKNQTHKNFKCLIAIDGTSNHLEKIVNKIIIDDDRFKIIGFSKHVGFANNFSRGLSYIDKESKWVALSDQDDFWYPEKLKTLIPYLEEYSLVSGQANVVNEKQASIIFKKCKLTTKRHLVSAVNLASQNQITGSFSIFNINILKIAIPIPNVKKKIHTQYHDQWLALCALSFNGIYILNAPLQNYVQHNNNVVGETKNNIKQSIVHIIDLCKKKFPNERNIYLIYKCINYFSFSGIGWRKLMADILEERLIFFKIKINPNIQLFLNVYSSKSLKIKIFAYLIKGAIQKEITIKRVFELMIILPFYKKNSFDRESHKSIIEAHSSNKNISIAAIISCYNPSKTINHLIDKLQNNNIDIYIINDGSDWNCNSLQNAHIIHLKENSGIAFSINYGIKIAKTKKNYDVFFTFDQDSCIDESYINYMLNTWIFSIQNTKQKIGMIIPGSYNSKKNSYQKSEDGVYDITSEPIQSGLLIPKQTFDLIGMFEEKFFIDSVDTEYYLRCLKFKLRCIVSPKANLIHKLGYRYTPSIFGKEIFLFNKRVEIWQYLPFRYYYVTRNRLILRKKYAQYFPKWLIKNIIWEIKHNFLTLLFGKNKIKNFKAIFIGFIHGIRGVSGKIPDKLYKKL